MYVAAFLPISIVSILKVLGLRLFSLFSFKVIYPKYSKHQLCTVAHTINCVCSKILNHGFKSWVIIFTFQVFCVKKHSKLT